MRVAVAMAYRKRLGEERHGGVPVSLPQRDVAEIVERPGDLRVRAETTEDCQRLAKERLRAGVIANAALNLTEAHERNREKPVRCIPATQRHRLLRESARLGGISVSAGDTRAAKQWK